LTFLQMNNYLDSAKERLAIKDKYCWQFHAASGKSNRLHWRCTSPRIFTLYLGLPSPSCKPLAKDFIGRHPNALMFMASVLLHPILFLEEASQSFMTIIRKHWMTFLTLQVYIPSKEHQISFAAKSLQHIMMPTWKTPSKMRHHSKHSCPKLPRFTRRHAIIEINGLCISPHTYPASYDSSNWQSLSTHSEGESTQRPLYWMYCYPTKAAKLMALES
jgi:hypothetical protein